MNKLSLATTAALTIRAEASTQLAMPGGSLIRASSFTPEVSVSVFLPFPPAGGKPWVGWGGTMAHRLGAHQPPASGLGWCGARLNPHSTLHSCNPSNTLLCRYLPIGYSSITLSHCLCIGVSKYTLTHIMQHYTYTHCTKLCTNVNR